MKDFFFSFCFCTKEIFGAAEITAEFRVVIFFFWEGCPLQLLTGDGERDSMGPAPKRGDKQDETTGPGSHPMLCSGWSQFASETRCLHIPSHTTCINVG